MLTTDEVDDQLTRLVDRPGWNFQPVGVVPQRLSFSEINTVFGFVRRAFVMVVLEAHAYWMTESESINKPPLGRVPGHRTRCDACAPSPLL